MSDLNDIVAVGLDLKPATLLHAYANGVFPWPSPGLPLLWYCPQKRGLLEFDRLHFSKRLRQYLKKSPWTYSVDRAFRAVLEGCSASAPGRTETWISDEMKDAYTALYQLGHAHSVEVWNGDRLVGGLYGVDTAGYFAGESMFHLEDNASKAAVLFAVALQKKVGRQWMDIQVISPHLEAMGAVEVPRAVFLKKLASAERALTFGSGIQPFRTEKEFLSYCDFCNVIE